MDHTQLILPIINFLVSSKWFDCLVSSKLAVRQSLTYRSKRRAGQTSVSYGLLQKPKLVTCNPLQIIYYD